MSSSTRVAGAVCILANLSEQFSLTEADRNRVAAYVKAIEGDLGSSATERTGPTAGSSLNIVRTGGTSP